MRATVAARAQITLPQAVRDALGLAAVLEVELDGRRTVPRKDASQALPRARGRCLAPGDPGPRPEDRQPR
jgi:antitoxin PrlF